MVNRIDIQVNATGNFGQLNAQIAELKAAVAQLQSKPLLGDSGRATTAQLSQIQTQFDKMLLSTRAFNVETVKMSNSIDNFGNRLQAGKLHFSEYARVYRQTMKGMRTELDALSDSQARVAKSVILPDALKTGYAKVITNLTSNLKSLNAAEEAAIIKTKALNSVIHGMGTSLVNMGKNTQWAGRQLTVGLTVPVAAFGAMAAKAFKDVNTELTRMQRMYGTGLSLPSEQEIAKVSTAIIDLSKKVAENMGIAQKETVTAAANFAAVGTTGDALIVATEQAMRLSKLGAVNADTAQKTITSLQTTFKVGTKDVAEAVNFLNDIQKQTSTDLQDLTDAIPRVGPIISQLGGTYKDTAVMMVAMKEAGVPAAQSANAIKSAVASMIGPTRQAREEFEKYGISLTKIKDNTQGNPIEMIEALQTSLQKLSPLVQAQLVEKLFGKFQFARVTALINNLGAAGSQTQNAFLVAKASVSELARLADSEMKIATESTTAKWSRALEGFKATLLPLGEKFMKFGTKVLDFFSKIMHFLDRFKPLENLLVNVLGGAALVGPVLMLVGLFGNLAGNIIKGVNYFRMFAQGAKDGGILAGFKSMASFFEMINIETLASSKNMDGLTTSTQKTVEAFAVLNQEIGIMTRSLNEVFARSTRMPIVASPYAQQTLAQLQTINPEYVGGVTKGLERPHMFPAARLWEGWAANEGNIQGRVPTLNAFLQNRALNPTMEAQENFMRGGMPEQWGAPVPSGGLAAQLQKEYGTEDVIHGPKFGLSKEDVYSRGFQKIENIRSKILDERIAADSKVAIELAKIDALPEEQKVQALTQIIQKVTFTEEQYFNNLIESLVQTQALLTAPEEMLKAVDTKVKTVLADPTIENKSVAIQAVLTEFNADFKLLGGTVFEEITKYRTLVQQTILSTTSTFETAIAAANFRAGIVASSEMFGGVRKGALGRFVSMDKQALSQSVLMARDIPKGFQTGGAIHAQDGVWVPGSGSGDRVPAMLEPGEFVVNRNAAKQYGGLLEHLNWNAAPRFGTGGKNPSSVPVGMRGYQTAGTVSDSAFAHIQPHLPLPPSDTLADLLYQYISRPSMENTAIKFHIDRMLDMYTAGNPDAFKGLRLVGNMGITLDKSINNALNTNAGGKGVAPQAIIDNLKMRYHLDDHPYREMLSSIGLSDSQQASLKPLLQNRIISELENMKMHNDRITDSKLYERMPGTVEDVLRSSGTDESVIQKLYQFRQLRTPTVPEDIVTNKWGLLRGHKAGTSTRSTFIKNLYQKFVGIRAQKGGGIPGYQSGLTVPSMASLNREEQAASMEEFIQKALRPSSALSLLQEEIFSAVSPSQLELIQKGYGHEVLQYNSNLAKILEQYTFNEKSFVLRPGYTPQRESFSLFNTLGKNERFHMGMSKTQFETWQPTSMFSTSERSPLFTRTLAQAIKEQGRGIGSIGIVPEELSLSTFSEKMYQNLRRRGMGIEVTGNEPDFRPNLYETNDVNLEESRTTTKHILDRLLRRITTDTLYNNSFTYNSQRPISGQPGAYSISRGFVDQMDVQHRIPELEARTTMMRFLRQSMFKQKGGEIPGYEEGGGPTWMARGNPYTEAQFQKSLESWIRPVLHGMAPWNNPEKDTYRPMGETYKGFYRDIFNDQMRNIGRQDLLRAMVVDNVKGGTNMHPWITNMVNAADDRYYPEGWMSESGNRVPPMANYQGPWEAETTRPFTSFTDIKDTDFLKKRFMPAFSDKRFWNAMVRGNKLPFFLHAMTGPETMGLPVSKLFAGQTYYGNEGEFLLPQNQKLPMTGYSSDLATRLPIVHSIAPGSTKMINGIRIPVAQTGGIIPGFTKGLTGPDFILEKLKKSFVPGAHNQGINGVFSLMDQAGEKGAFFLKQMFFGGNEAQTTMALEAFMNQLHRGLGGPNAAVDQVVARIADKQLKEHLALKSPFLEEMQTYDAIGKAGQKSTILGPESQINAKETIKRYLEALLTGNKDLHSGNFGFLQGRNPIIIDSGEHFANSLNYNVNSASEIERMKRVSQTTILPEFNEVANQAAIKLMRPDFDVMDFRRSQIELMKSKVTESFIQDLLMKATSNNPELISLMDRKATNSLGKPFAAGMTEILKSRLSSMGSIFRAQGGSWVPGSGDGDRVPAMLEPGEYVINKKAAKSYGGLLEDINFNKAPRFATGNEVGNRQARRGNVPIEVTKQQVGANIKEFNDMMAGVPRIGSTLIAAGQSLKVSILNGAQALKQSAIATREANMTRGMIAKNELRGLGASVANAIRSGISGISKTPGAMINGIGAFGQNAKQGIKEGGRNFGAGFMGARREQMLLDENGNPVLDEKGNTRSRYTKFSEAKGVGGKLGYALGRQARPGMGSMIGGQMVGMAGMQMTAGMEEGTAKSAISGASMGAMLGGMTPLGPIGGAAIGAIASGAYSVYKQHEQKLKNAASLVKESLNMSVIAMQHLGVQARDFSNVMINSAGNVTKATSEYQVQVNDYKNAQDEETKTAIQGIKDKLDSGDIEGIKEVIKTRVATQMSSIVKPNDPEARKKVMLDNQAFLASSGAGLSTQKEIFSGISPKTTTPESAIKQQLKQLGLFNLSSQVSPTLVPPLPARNPGENSISWTIKNLGALAAGTILGNGPKQSQATKLGSSTIFDESKMPALITQLQTKTDPMQLGKMLGPLNKTNADVKLFRESMSTVGDGGAGWKQLLESVKKMDPALAKLDQQYGRYITDGTQIIRINNLMSSGMNQLNISQQQLINTNPNILSGLEAQYSAQNAVTGGIADWVSNAVQYDAQQNDQTDAANKAAKALQNQKDNLNDLINSQGDYISSQNKAIDKVQKEMDARNKLADTQDKEIERQRTLADLRDSITSARASGNLLEMASAQSQYNEELAKQEEAKKKEAADANDEKKIAGFKANIDKANSQIDKYNKKLEELDKVSNNSSEIQSKNWNTVSGKAHDAETAVNDVGTAIKNVGTSGTWTSLETFQEQVLGEKGMKGKLDAAGISSDDVKGKIKELYESFGGTEQAKANEALSGVKDSIDEIANASKKALAVSIFTKMFTDNPDGDIKDMAKRAAEAAAGFINATGSAPTSPPPLTSGIKNGEGDGQWYQDPQQKNYYWLVDDKKFSDTPSDVQEMKNKQKYGWHNYKNGKWGATLKKAEGGYIRGPGDSTSDSIPARLSNGEYVVKASSVARYGTSFLDGVNEQRFATGGPVGFKNGGKAKETELDKVINYIKTMPYYFGKPDTYKMKPMDYLVMQYWTKLSEDLQDDWYSQLNLNPIKSLTNKTVKSLQDQLNDNFVSPLMLLNNKRAISFNTQSIRANFTSNPLFDQVRNSMKTGILSMFGLKRDTSYDGVSNYNPAGNYIQYNPENDSFGSYGTLYHETGHWLDRNLLSSNSNIIKNGGLGGLGEAVVGMTANKLKNGPGWQDIAYKYGTFDKGKKSFIGYRKIPVEESRADVWKGVMSRVLNKNYDSLGGDTLDKASKGPLEEGISMWFPYYDLYDDTHPRSWHGEALAGMGYSNPTLWLKFLGLRYPTKWNKFKNYSKAFDVNIFKKAKGMDSSYDLDFHYGKTAMNNARYDLLRSNRYNPLEAAANTQTEAGGDPTKPDWMDKGKTDYVPKWVTQLSKPKKFAKGGLAGNNIPGFDLGGLVRNIFGKKDKDKKKPGYGSWWSAIMDSSDRDKRKGFWGSGVLHDVVNPYVELGRGVGYGSEYSWRQLLYGNHSKNSKNQGFEDNPFRGKDGAKRLFGDVMLAWGAPKLVGKAAKITKPLWNPIVSPITKAAKKGLSWAGKGLSSAGSKIVNKNIKNVPLQYLDIVKQAKEAFKFGKTLNSDGYMPYLPNQWRTIYTPKFIDNFAKKYATKRDLVGDWGPDYMRILQGNIENPNFAEKSLSTIYRMLNPSTGGQFAKNLYKKSKSLGSGLTNFTEFLSKKKSQTMLSLDNLRQGTLYGLKNPNFNFTDIIGKLLSKKYSFKNSVPNTKLINKLEESFGGVNNEGVTGVFDQFDSITGKNTTSYIKQVFERLLDADGHYYSSEDLRAMGKESFLNQFIRGLSGPKSAIDQVIRRTEFNGIVNNVLSSPFEELNSIPIASDLATPGMETTRQLIRRHLEAVLTGNWDLHSKNIMFSPDGTPKIVDSGLNLFSTNSWGSIKSLLPAQPFALGMHDNRQYLDELLAEAEKSVGKKDFSRMLKAEIYRISRRTNRRVISDAFKRATLGDKAFSKELNLFSEETFGKDFVTAITEIMKTRAKQLPDYYRERQTHTINNGIFHANGGYISGAGGPREDLIPAMLSNGEYVIQSAAVSKYGQSMLDAINGGNFGPKYATGGIIKSYSVGGSTNDSSISLPAPQYNVNIVVNGANASADDIADMVATRFRRETESMSTGRSLRA